MDQIKEMATFGLNVRKILSVTIAAAVVCCLAAPRRLVAASPDKGATLTFSASGTFTTNPVSGADTLKLSGQPFTISITGNTSKKPTKHGRNWAVFNPLQMTGTVYSGLIPNQAIPISATAASLKQTVGATEDIIEAAFPVTVIGIALQIKAYITLPGGTLSKALLRPFASVTIGPPSSTVTYSNSTAATVLGIESGTLSATLPAGGTEVSAVTAPSPLGMLSGALAVKPRGLLINGQ
jgi:hypothetical protein